MVVFQTPPEAAVTKYSLVLLGLTAKSLTRPEVTAGPMLRKESPLKVSDFHRSFLSGAASFFFCAVAVDEIKIAKREMLRRNVFMSNLI